MKPENLNQITETISQWVVKDLRYKPMDNIIVGLVQDKLFGNPNFFEGYVSCQWTTRGKPLNKNKGRAELILKM